MPMQNYEGPSSQEEERGMSIYVPYSLSWKSSGPSEAEVPLTTLYKDNTKQNRILDEQRKEADKPSPTYGRRRRRNPMPPTGSRRDACGGWSIGSQGHASGCCQGPCKDIRSGRGCTWGKKCKKCHCPHPDISSTSLRSKKFRANTLSERLARTGLDHEWHVECFGSRCEDCHPREHEAACVSAQSNMFLYTQAQLPSGTSIFL
eukprot:TRINITY_DN9244_c0_g1_i1.p1 TRINITY_DN9244_c0_g1~~TRINITY_DN9244_c0_g1_i1.p1  ORF type:complete len:216 (-),score=18.77 TRINITY_DN9244_c0_g1_i1:324-935(-)